MSNPTAKAVSPSLDKTVRHKLAKALLRVSIAYQIREMRLSRGWSQAQLAAKISTKQSAIARLERPYGKLPAISTLRAIAKAFDVGLLVGFTSWSEFIKHHCNENGPPIPPGFDTDTGLLP